MIFLVEYSRADRALVSKVVYEDAQRDVAQRDRLDLELRLQGMGVDHEVVLLDATDEESLRRTHERYFQPVEEFAQPVPNA